MIYLRYGILKKQTITPSPPTPASKTTEQIRYELGNFEKEIQEDIAAEPGFTLGKKFGTARFLTARSR